MPLESTVLRGVPVLNPMDALIALGAVCRPVTVARAVDSALQRQLVSLPGMHAALERVARRGRPGVGVMRRLLADRTEAPAGVLEAAAARAFRRHNVEGLVAEYEVFDGDHFVARSDFAKPEVMLLIELDGFAFHSSPDQLRRDHERQNMLERLGYTVLRFTPAHVFQSPDQMVRVILATIRRLTAVPGTLRPSQTA